MAVAVPVPALKAASTVSAPNPATSGLSSSSDGAGDNSNPYAIITDRNVFRLNPPPPPPSAEKKPVDMPKVYLSGIIKIGDDVRVLFSIPPKDAKSPTSYFNLSPGEKDDVLELVRVHPDQQEVDVLVNGMPMTLSVASNSLAASGGAVRAPGTRKGPAPGPPPPGFAGAAPHESSAIIAGGDTEPSRYGGVAVGGGGGAITTIGGGDSSSSRGGYGGVSVGGGSSFGNGSGGNGFGGGGGVNPSSGVNPSAYGSGSSYGGVSISGGGNANTSGEQSGNTVVSATPNSSVANNLANNLSNLPAAGQPELTPGQQALNLAAQTALADQEGKQMPPLPPGIQSMVDGGSGDSDNQGGQGGPRRSPMAPPMPP
jgi:hypothetical protein